jgi:2-keto-4-pentenoate hydratase
MSDTSAILAAADRLARARASGETCAPVRDLIGADDLAAAYAVQTENHRIRIARGERPIGAKVALSSKAVQAQMGVGHPTHGRLYADAVVAEGVEIPFSALIQPKLETEVAIVLERPLDRIRHTVADVISAVAYCVPAFEIVGSRVTGWDVKVADFVADNSAASHVVLGTRPKKLADFDVLRCRMETRRADAVVSSGTGAACAGNPLAALIWIADTLAAEGRPLQAGDLIMTGSLGPMAIIAPGDRFEAEIEGLGRIETAFSAA